MIYQDSIEAVLEALYLDEQVGLELGKSNVRVNPVNDRLKLCYTKGKTVVLNDSHVNPQAVSDILSDNTVISRVRGYGHDDRITVQPYITRIVPGIMWNGEVLDCPESISHNNRDIMYWIFGDIDNFPCPYNDGGNFELYFPKINGLHPDAIYDVEGNINILGWVLHQVGQNTDRNTKLKDLDLLKTKKIII